MTTPSLIGGHDHAIAWIWFSHGVVAFGFTDQVIDQVGCDSWDIRRTDKEAIPRRGRIMLSEVF